ncbi:hypothetical protein [Mucilaginibacter sp. FT3.2]|uniref:PD-(D/E)XK nuclease domain-containing protein n=1 Tax=Mucilaginibacter sp. FT3.2 TaxID=2723090 RepID=UPI00160E5AAB|nr:hypothetical protein [Mucilaginibacter sp. FT3.2]MBB6232431.1 hypothetical protein [Mucilaginibacter sp. FT3.2]
MSEPLETDYLATQIRDRISALSSEYYKHTMQEEFEDLHDRDGTSKAEMMDWVHDTLKRIYVLILAYLETQRLPVLAETFRNRYENRLDDKGFMLDAGAMPFDEGRDSYLYRLREFEDFLLAFRTFDIFREEKRISTNMLESVLSNSHLIVKKTKTVIKTETTVYKAIEWFLQMMYPEIIYSKAPLFPGKFKHYSADLFIPELQTAIEYKLVDPNDNPEDYIDQIKIDAVNYRGDDRYNLFYAVVYFRDNETHKLETLQSCWRSKHFPANWKPIFVFG